MSRSGERAQLDTSTRLLLLEKDTDTLEATCAALVAEIKVLRGRATALLVALATSSLLLAINVVVQQNRP